MNKWPQGTEGQGGGDTTIYTSRRDVCCPSTPSHESPPKGTREKQKSLFSLRLL